MHLLVFAWKCRLTWQLSVLLFIPLLLLSARTYCVRLVVLKEPQNVSLLSGERHWCKRLVSIWETDQVLLKLQFYSVFFPSIPWIVFECHMLGTELGTREIEIKI